MTGTAALEDTVEVLAARARREVDDGLLPSCQWALALDGEIIAGETVGDTPAGDDTRYVIFSCTKAVVVSAVWQLLAEGALSLDQRVAELVPEFGTNDKEQVTVEQVLLHTSGFPRAPMGPRQWFTREGRLARFAQWRLNWEPGTRYEYHPTSAHWVLAEIIERLDGVDYRAAIRRRVLDPLKLSALALGVPADEQRDVAHPVVVGDPPTAQDWHDALGVDGYDVGEVTEDNMIVLARPENLEVGVPGGGAVSTAADLARFYQELLHNEHGLWDAELLADATGRVRHNLPDPQTGVPANRALGVVVAGGDGRSAGRGFGHTVGPRTFGHDGAYGQIAYADPDTGVSFAWFTNGLDRHLIRHWRRTAGIASKAGVVTP